MPRRPRSPYDHTWRKLRLRILARDGYRCYEPGCPTRADQVDHIVPLSEGGARLDPANLRAACRAHNIARRNSRIAALAKVNRDVGTLRQW